jgi:hypothetical protein
MDVADARQADESVWLHVHYLIEFRSIHERKRQYVARTEQVALISTLQGRSANVLL